MVKANNENRKELRLDVKIELPFDAAGPPLRLSSEKTRIEKTQTAEAPLQQYSQEARHGNNRNVHQQMNGQRGSDQGTQWNISYGKQ